MIAAALFAAAGFAAEPVDADAIWARLSSVPHLQASFTQTQTRKLLRAPLVSHGTLAFERPDRLRWETTGAGASVFVISGTEVAARMPGVEQVMRVDLSTQPQLAGLVSGLTVWLAGDAEAVRAQYDLTLESAQLAVLRPKDPILRKAVSSVTVRIADEGTYLSEVSLLEPDGDTTTITLSDVELGAPAAAGLFQLSADDGSGTGR